MIAGPDRVQRGRRGDEEAVALRAAEGEVGRGFGQVQLADQRAVRIEAVHALADACPDSPGVVQANAVEVPGGVVGEQLAASRGRPRSSTGNTRMWLRAVSAM